MSTPAATEPVTPMPLDADPPLADLPVDGALHGFDPVAHRVFKALNRWFMIPASRAGLGAWIGSPIGGYVLLLRAKGRKSGLVRETPLSYLIADGSIWVLAGFGPRTDWYRNLLAEPAVEVMLPGRLVHGRASEVRSLEVRRRIVPAISRATGLPSFLGGFNPWRATDEDIIAALSFVPLIRIDANEGWLDAGGDDPGGKAWIWRQLVVLGVTLLVARAMRRLVRRPG